MGIIRVLGGKLVSAGKQPGAKTRGKASAPANGKPKSWLTHFATFNSLGEFGAWLWDEIVKTTLRKLIAAGIAAAAVFLSAYLFQWITREPDDCPWAGDWQGYTQSLLMPGHVRTLPDGQTREGFFEPQRVDITAECHGDTLLISESLVDIDERRKNEFNIYRSEIKISSEFISPGRDEIMAKFRLLYLAREGKRYRGHGVYIARMNELNNKITGYYLSVTDITNEYFRDEPENLGRLELCRKGSAARCEPEGKVQALR